MANDEITLSKEDADQIHTVLGKSWNAIRKLNPSLARMIRDAQTLLVEPDGGEEAAQQSEPDTAPASQVLGMPATNEAGAAVDAAEQLDLNDEPAESQDESKPGANASGEILEEDAEETAKQ